MSEDVCKEHGIAVEFGKLSFRGNEKQTILGKIDGIVKFVTEKDTKKSS
ncbi:hypothetical protein CDO51_05615 [Natranaerobius trueperi]|uniref:Uncharacterized protein n=2 Tax=Natranaerobius trueperi TaxID=759412 RepID=A0A226BYF8_9FIRM|nr:hypothetical protein CDO51_05615 [Natranaerobius trueperi]